MKTHRERVLARLGLSPSVGHSIPELADASRIPAHVLQQVYNRGIGAWRTIPQSVRLKGSFKKDPSAPISMKLSKEQWAMARVYSFIDRGKTFQTADSDLAEKYSIKE
jgi:hypothetical protein